MNTHTQNTWNDYAILFRILARGLTCPDLSMQEALSDGSYSSEVASVYERLSKHVERGHGHEYENAELPALLKATVHAQSQGERREALSRLRREYTRLFTAPEGARLAIWETLFLDPQRNATDFGTILIRSKEAVDARRRYENAGVNLAQQESADHMRIECEFAGYLCSRIATSEDAATRELWSQHLDGFIAVHLQRWFKPFFGRLAEESEHPFYRSLAQLGISVNVETLRQHVCSP